MLQKPEGSGYLQHLGEFRPNLFPISRIGYHGYFFIPLDLYQIGQMNWGRTKSTNCSYDHYIVIDTEFFAYVLGLDIKIIILWLPHRTECILNARF